MRISDWSSDVCSSDLVQHWKFVRWLSASSTRRWHSRLGPATPTSNSHAMQTGSRRAQICARRWTPSSHAARSQEPWTSSKQITARCSLKQDLRSRLSAAVILAHSPATAFRALWPRYRASLGLLSGLLNTLPGSTLQPYKNDNDTA